MKTGKDSRESYALVVDEFIPNHNDTMALVLSRFQSIGIDAEGTVALLGLTRDLAVPNSGAGRALYSKPIQIPAAGDSFSASFSTFFSFSVTNLNPPQLGRTRLLISPDDSAVGDSGYLGLMNQTGGPIGTVAVKFDTLMDVQFMDINKSCGFGSKLDGFSQDRRSRIRDVDLKSGDLVNSWIDYSGSTRIFNISVSYSNLKPGSTPIIHSRSRSVRERFHVCWVSGSTQGVQRFTINWWSFSSNFEVSSKSESSSPHHQYRRRRRLLRRLQRRL
ncbi:L-type lectin-domain containing receptor kinase VIII.2 [Camellia lanceoleosa]|uniref:L-type lectin-domain containing receptor kinase VIII.2 n=1 Tax=Camellia lanceoleosa TaxID=1840588 RepID=A0ACC0HL28_9ERIC|nr:L-type lectin-domain containing receptor kinase VIII.2 [Camellia lanceoleosa]